MTALGTALTLSVLFHVAFFAFILFPSSSPADVTGSFAVAFPFFSVFFYFVFILFFSGIIVALATRSKPGISPHPVPLELKLDGGGESENASVRVRS